MAEFAARYARAFAEVATSAKLPVADAESQLRDFAETLAGSLPLRNMLSNPSFSTEQKVKVLDALCAKTKYALPVRNFLAVIIAHDRIREFDGIAAAYAALAAEEQGIHSAEITTAHPLDEAGRNALEARIGAIAGGKLVASYKQDASLLGGAVVRLGSTVYDGSVRGQLDRLKKQLAGA